MADVLPLPEIIGERKFEVRRSPDTNTAYIDLESNQLVVPFEDNPHSDFIRAHESGHLTWTPIDGKIRVRDDVADRSIQCAEDCRINAGLRTIGVDTAAIPTEPQTFEIRDNDLGNAQTLIGLKGRYEYADFADRLREINPTLEGKVDAIISEIIDAESRGNVAPFESTLEIAETITDTFSASPFDSESEPGEGDSSGDTGAAATDVRAGEGTESPDTGEGASVAPDASEDDSAEDEEDDLDESSSKPKTEKDAAKIFGIPDKDVKLSSMTEDEKRELQAQGIEGISGDSDPMKEKLVYAELNTPMKRVHGRGKRASDAGDIPVLMHRLTSDQRIFKSKRPAPEAVAIAIDCSGSMSMQTEDIEMILRTVPSSIVMCYSGPYMVVIAHNNRMIDPKVLYEMKHERWIAKDAKRPYFEGSNGTDYQAIKWLAARKERRKLWVCDGIVTGEGDMRLKPKYLREMAAIMKSNKIVRIPSIEYLADHKDALIVGHALQTVPFGGAW